MKRVINWSQVVAKLITSKPGFRLRHLCRYHKSINHPLHRSQTFSTLDKQFAIPKVIASYEWINNKIACHAARGTFTAAQRGFIHESSDRLTRRDHVPSSPPPPITTTKCSSSRSAAASRCPTSRLRDKLKYSYIIWRVDELESIDVNFSCQKAA